MIKVLDPETVGQIAAGEVVERPLSVVKELVENALDASAGRVSVRVRGGGLDEIEVADDGCGIAADELTLAVRRHATSKLSDARGLFSIRTLGFRGEGLASIAAVSHLTVISRVAGEQLGSAIEAHGEAVVDPQPHAGPIGTRVIVRDLFGNVPVRREYMRSARAEFARISNWLATISLAYPQVAFSLSHNGEPTWSLAADPNVGLRLTHVFGHAAASRLLPIDAAPTPLALDVRVAGYVSEPGHDRPDRRMQLLFVNGRPLRSSLFAGAWSAAYSTYAMVGRHPFGVLFAEVAPEAVDPNVHPTKTDVRLRYGDHVHAVVKAALAETLRRNSETRLRAAVSFAPAATRPAVGQPSAGDAAVAPVAAPSLALSMVDAQRRLSVLAQLDASYIAATDGISLVIVDQHAAHERIAYEALAANADGFNASEPLLLPYNFEVSAAQDDNLAGALEALRAGGLAIDHFGERTYRVTATPSGYRLAGSERRRSFDPIDFVEGLNDDMPGLGPHERVWASLACHSVVRAGERLEFAEMAALLAGLESCRNPMHCPHGRPTIVRLQPIEIARLFKRL